MLPPSVAGAPPRVTECANPLTARLGDYPSSLDAAGVLRLLCACDAQLFVGSDGLPSVYCAAPLTAAARASEAVAAALVGGGGVLFVGCGTSGRLAHLLAAQYNACWRSAGRSGAPFGYCLAGGDAALLVPAESVEDEPATGAADVTAWAAGERGVAAGAPLVLIGISCGLSASYVVGALDAGLLRPATFAVALGFNDAAAVAAVAVPGRGGGFAGVLARLAAAPARGAVINPVVGAEAVAGSSRMKGGSATLLLCAAVCDVGVRAALLGPLPPPSLAPAAATLARVRGAIMSAEGAVRAMYALASPALAAVLGSAARALCSARGAVAAAAPASSRYVTPSATGRIIYLGRGAAGLLGLVDASEGTDTYGSAFNDVRAFTCGGWPRMAVAPGAADPAVPLELRGYGRGDTAAAAAGAAAPPAEFANPDLAAFRADFVPTLSPADCVVALWSDGEAGDTPAACAADAEALLAAMAAAAAAGARVHCIVVREDGAAAAGPFAPRALACAAAAGAVDIALPHLAIPADAAAPRRSLDGALPPSPAAGVPSLGLLALKLALNALTTGAHVARGVVVGNRMVNMMLTNHKLYLRALGIVGTLAGCDVGAARSAVLRAVYALDDDRAVRALEDAEAREPARALDHVARAAVTAGVIPTALLLADAAAAAATLSVADARAALAETPRVAEALERLRRRR